ncbi:12482_t:CDS:1 [Racocetra fulgida]|uniref:12482_t:CDS:1 n=1 Tax=Racocetra fulgida TaxID=60492 RepID=A0A9N8WF57_9GLOM|nr:12482_t:CDS:1 [Racocetra fulgida]
MRLKKVIQNTQPITIYLVPILTSFNVVLASTFTFGFLTELCTSTKVALIKSKSIEKKLIKVELVELIEAKLVKSIKMELVELIEIELVKSIKMKLVKSIEIKLVKLIETKLVKLIADVLAEIDEKTKMRLVIEELDLLLKKQSNRCKSLFASINAIFTIKVLL